MFYYCPGCTDGRPYVHTVLCNGMDGNGYMKAYSHNNANNGQQKYHYSRNCPYCGTKIAYAIAYHFEGGSTDPSTLAFQGINWPTAVACGDPYSIYGTVSSNYPIHYVGVYIYDLDGNEVQSKVVMLARTIFTRLITTLSLDRFRPERTYFRWRPQMIRTVLYGQTVSL